MGNKCKNLISLINDYKKYILTITIILLILGGAYVFNNIISNSSVPKEELVTNTGTEEEDVYEIKNIEIKTKLINKLVNDQKFDKALNILNSIYNEDKTDLNIVLNYANILSNIGSINREEKKYGEQAIIFANYALEINPNSSEAYRIIGYSNEIMEKYEEAFVAYNKSIELDNKNYLAYSNIGHAYKLIGDRDLALENLLKSYELNSNIDHNLLNLANIYLGKGDFDKALKFYNKVLDITLNIRFKSEALFSIGHIFIKDKNYIDAKNTFIKAIKIDPKFELGYIGLGEVQFLMFLKEVESKKLDDNIKVNNSLVDLALGNLVKAININPNKTLSYYKLTLIYTDLGLYEQAEKFLKKSLQVLPNDITLSKDEKEVFFDIINNLYKKGE